MDKEIASEATQELIDLYIQGWYRVDTHSGSFVMRVGNTSADAALLLVEHGACFAAFITAWNPKSRVTKDADNRKANKMLLKRLREFSIAVIEGSGGDDAGQWQPEDSFLAIGISRQHAENLAKRFGQNAFIWVYSDGYVELVCTN